LQPRIQGHALNMPSILIFLGVIAGGEIAGFLGIIFAVPTLAVLKVLFDFFPQSKLQRGRTSLQACQQVNTLRLRQAAC